MDPTKPPPLPTAQGKEPFPWDQLGLAGFCAGWFFTSLDEPVRHIWQDPNGEPGGLGTLGVVFLLVGGLTFLGGLVRRGRLKRKGIVPPKYKWLTVTSGLLFAVSILITGIWIPPRPQAPANGGGPVDNAVNNGRTVDNAAAIVGRTADSPAANAATWRTITAVDGQSVIDAPPGWKYAAELVPALGQVAVMDSTGNVVVVAGMVNKRDLVTETLAKFGEHVLATHVATVSNYVPIKALTQLDGDANRMEALGTANVGNDRLSYLISVVETPTHFGVVISFTPPSQFDERLPLMREITARYRLAASDNPPPSDQ